MSGTGYSVGGETLGRVRGGARVGFGERNFKLYVDFNNEKTTPISTPSLNPTEQSFL